jgi:hypothetical protein
MSRMTRIAFSHAADAIYGLPYRRFRCISVDWEILIRLNRVIPKHEIPLWKNLTCILRTRFRTNTVIKRADHQVLACLSNNHMVL